MTHYDIALIGTGSGNTIVDHDFADLRVAIIEKGVFGGTCLNVGCIPTKMYVYPADLARGAGDGERLGVETSFDGVDWPAVRDRVFGRIDPIAQGGQEYREGLPNVDVIHGTGRFTGPRRLVVDTADGPVDVEADQVVLATGSRPLVPPVPGLDDVTFHTSDTVMRLETFPRRVGIIGGGYIGAEFAHVFSAFGAQVTQVHRGARLLQAEDEAVSKRFTEIAATQWDLRLSANLTKVTPADDGAVRLELDDGGETLEVDCLLLATGRVPNSDLLDLDAAGVEVDTDDRIVVDAYQRTTAPGVWALGDASSPDMLKHVANQDARVVQHNLLHPDDLQESDHRFVPSAIFSSPQVASVGLTEQEAVARGLDVATVTQDYGDVAYGWAMEDTSHFVKLVVDRRERALVGAHLIGPQASILVQPLVQALSFGLPLEGLARGQYWIHPALAEVVENALLAAESVLR